MKTELGLGSWAFTCAVIVSVAATAACGKKGPPLLPYVRIPKPAEITSARRVGNDVYVTVTVPSADVDDATPASIQQIEIYALTALTLPPAGAFLANAKPVATIPVARAADPSDKSGRFVPDPKTGALQGDSVTIRDSLSADELEPTPIERLVPTPVERPIRAGRSGGAGSRMPQVTDALPGVPQVLRRFYVAVPFSDRRRPGPLGAVVEVPMTSMPGKVPAIRVAMAGHAVDLQWEPAGGLLGWLMDRALPMEVAPVDDRPTATASAKSPTPAAPSGPALYNVYLELADPLAPPGRRAPQSPWASSAPAVPINTQPLTTLKFSEDVPFDERKRCYHVRAVRGTGSQRVESEPSDPECIIPVDVEPPAAPTGLQATAIEGSISLRWEPNGEEDLRGYIVLRRAAGDDTLAQLTSVPIAKTGFTDTDPKLTAGQMYTYVVQAVDNRIPLPNVSDPIETTVTAQ